MGKLKHGEPPNLIEATVIAAVLITALGLLFGALCAPREPGEPNVYSWNAVSFTHDGHRWIRPAGAEGPLVHHPDCPCQKRAEVQ